MMGVWHFDSLKAEESALQTLVGHEPDRTAKFAQKFDYQQWTVNLALALASDIDVVITALPSATHANGS